MTGPGPTAQPATLADTAIALTLGTDRAAAITPDAALTAAAVSGARARAGFIPINSAEPVTACPPDERTECTPAAAARLAQILRTNDADLLEEWSRLANSADRIAPSHLAAAMLPHAVGNPFRPNPVFDSLGARGPWLAALDPRFAPRMRPMQASEIPEHLWETGTTGDRVQILRSLRERDPAAAIDLARSTWTSDGAADRAKIIEALATGLGPDDEPFVESALDDRSKQVRRTAAELLSILPGSAHQRRMAERLATLVRVEPRKILQKSPRVRLEPPAAFDPSWERDGLEPKPQGGFGERAWWLYQIIALAPLETWTALTGLEPRAVIQSIESDDHAKEAFEAILTNITRKPNPEWVTAVAAAELARKSVRLHQLTPLWNRLPPADAERAVLPLLEDDLVPAHELLALLASAGWAWSEGFGRVALLLAHKHRKSLTVNDWGTPSWLRLIAGRIDPKSFDLFDKLVRALYPEPTPKVTESLDRARFRAEMHKEFAS